MIRSPAFQLPNLSAGRCSVCFLVDPRLRVSAENPLKGGTMRAKERKEGEAEIRLRAVADAARAQAALQDAPSSSRDIRFSIHAVLCCHAGCEHLSASLLRRCSFFLFIYISFSLSHSALDTETATAPLNCSWLLPSLFSVRCLRVGFRIPLCRVQCASLPR